MSNYMKVALKEAFKAYKNQDIPVGAVIVMGDKIIAKAYNKKNLLKDPTRHAEIIAIEKACKRLGDFRLEGATMYVTKEPCVMCYGACLSARIDTVFYGAKDMKYSVDKLRSHIKFNHNTNFIGGVMEEECAKLLSDFFENLRREKCKQKN